MRKMQATLGTLTAVWLLIATPVFAANLSASPGDNLQTKINSLNAGDTLTLNPGTYNVSRLSIIKQGTATGWITIQGAVGSARPVLQNPGGENMFNVSNTKYVKFLHLEITGGVNGEDAFKITGTGNSDLIVEDCYMHDIGGHGIGCAALTGPLQRLTVRRCEISYTHANAETMYLGNNDGVGTVMNSLFEGNYLHHTLAGAASNQGDGIDLNLNCAGNIFRDNVIHDTYLNCFTIETGNVSPPNLFERNVCWNSTADSTFQCNGGAILRNNIFFGSALYAANFHGSGIVALNNVFHRSSGYAVNFGNGTNIVFANNIVDGDAHLGGSLAGTLRNNYWKITALGTNQIAGAPGYNAAGKNFYPTQASYINAGWNAGSYQPADDFNTTPRSGAPDIGAYELVTASNPGWAIVAGFKLNRPAVVNQAPVIVSPAAATPNPVVNATTTSVSVSASDPDSGPAALTYAWSAISGPGTVSFSPNGSATANVATATFGASGTYSLRVTVSDGSASVTSTISGLSVTLPSVGTAPNITGQPTAKTVTVGQTATFTVVATGTATLTYQWRKNDVNIVGATSASYTTPATVSANNGATYRVVVSNSYGSITSNAATLTVNPAATAPTITAQPTNKTVTAPATATFSVTATGATGYQWQKNDVNIAGATGSSYTTAATTTADSGSLFRVRVSNAVGTTTSNAATLTVNPAVGSNPITPSTTLVTLGAPTGSSAPVITTLILTNTTGAPITVTPVSGASWLTTSGAVVAPANGTVTMTLTALPNGLSGVLTANLVLTNSTGESQTISVQLSIDTPGDGRGKGRGCAIATESEYSLAMLTGVLGLWLWLIRRRRTEAADC